MVVISQLSIGECSEVSDVFLEGRRVDQMRVCLIDKLSFRVHETLGPGECFMLFDLQVASMVFWFSKLALVVVTIFIIDLD